MGIFISYTHPDRDFAERLAKDLMVLGFDVFGDFLQVTAGDLWKEKVIQLREMSHTFIICVSENIKPDSYFLIDEIPWILDYKQTHPEIRLIPILLSYSWDAFDKHSMLTTLKDYHVAQFRGYNSALVHYHEYRQRLEIDLSRGVDVDKEYTQELNNLESRLETIYIKGLEDLLKGLSKPRIFISYRRDDSADTTDIIYDRLAQKFGAERVIRDIENIPRGVDFRQYLRHVILVCAVQLVIIGKDWITITDANTGQRRLDNPADFVRLEVESAIQRDISVIPVLVQDGTMPSAGELPQTLSSLPYRNATKARRKPDFDKDMESLISDIEKILDRYF